MKKPSVLISRPFLALVGLAVGALLIWFVGPFLALGEGRPLIGVGMRIAMIALLTGALLLWLTGASAGPALVALACLLIWYGAPFVGFGALRPFASAYPRATLIAVLLAGCAAYGLLRFWQRMRSDEQFLRKALAFGGRKQMSAASLRLRPIEAHMTRVLARLKAMRHETRGIARIFQPTRYLYEVPWYIVLGAGDSGKSALLLNAGLAIAERIESTEGTERTNRNAAHTSAGVAKASIDWWLTNRAVLIDTAGYYTQHGSSWQALPVSSGLSSHMSARATPRAVAARNGTNAASATSVGGAELAPPLTLPGALGPSNHTDPDQRPQIDQAEWFGFLALLRKHRARAPLNGALLVVDCASLASADKATLATQAARLRARLAELRERLGIRFPVYLFVTQMDRVPGFADYFSSLPAESRTQQWGFTLPANRPPADAEALVHRCATELALLVARLVDGVDMRLSEEHDAHRRRRLLALPGEFGALTSPLRDLVEQVFADSRYDRTQAHSMLRGIYFASALQDGREIVVERQTVLQRLLRHLPSSAPLQDERQGAASDSFFLRDVFTRIVLPEAHLVRANLRWEHRSRMASLLAHLFALLLFAWIASGLLTSYRNNHGYLDAVANRIDRLALRTARLEGDDAPATFAAALSEAQALPTYPGLDLATPERSFLYGLFTARDIAAQSGRTYDALADQILLPHLVRRLEDAIRQGIARNDPKTTYDALRVYLMLSDPAKFSAADIRTWLHDDSVKADDGAVGGDPTLADHLARLFSGKRIVQAPALRDDTLVDRARAFLDGNNATQRLYERAKTAMQREAPDDFTLLRALGPQAGTLFARASGASLARGVPGLYTFDGYRDLFDRRLPEFVHTAREDDAWVMGRAPSWPAANPTPDLPAAARRETAPPGAASATLADTNDDPLTMAIRRQYLLDYAREWDTFLGDLRTVADMNLAASLRTLRSFAAPDSPLARLVRAVVRETSLTQPPASAADESLLQKAGAQLSRNTGAWLGVRSEARLERELVDARFGALREIVSGSAEPSAVAQAAITPGGKTGFDGIVALLNDHFNALSAAELALNNHSMPPASDSAARLKLLADTLPAPLRDVLRGLATQGSREVNAGIGHLLSRQLDAVIGDTCRLAVEGNYPFMRDAARDIRIDDFTRVFALGGLLDDFFTKNLAQFVDTRSRPWRYKTLPGSTEPVQGPDLEPFQHAQAIRAVFFDAASQKQVRWDTEIRIVNLDATITDLLIDIDGQTDLYRHGPVRPFTAAWPGPRGGAHAELSAGPRIRPDTSTLTADGPWALLHLLDKGAIADTATSGRTRVSFIFDGRHAVLDLANASGVANPLTSDVLRTFRCPTSMPVFALPDDGPPPGLPRAALATQGDG
jgi:type VI secretion system protein ImpL